MEEADWLRQAQKIKSLKEKKKKLSVWVGPVPVRSPEAGLERGWGKRPPCWAVFVMLVLWLHAETSGPDPRNDYSQSHRGVSGPQQGQHPPGPPRHRERGAHTSQRRSSPGAAPAFLLIICCTLISCLWAYRPLSSCCGHGNFYPLTMNHSFV